MKTYQTAEIVVATKSLVDSLLSINKSNRPPKKRVIETYCRDIKAGKWKLTNQGIGITRDNVIADGQHRLFAIRECGYPPIPLLIVRGLDPDVQIVIDTHAKRSARDAIQFSFGVRVTRCAPAIAGVLHRATSGTWRGAITNNELLDIIAEFQDEIETVTSAPSKITFYAAPYLAAFCLALSKNPHAQERIVKFIKDVESGEMLDRKMPEYHLRKFIETAKGMKGGGDVQVERFFKAHKALIASLRGEKMGVLRY
jgi:hypothetical protein